MAKAIACRIRNTALKVFVRKRRCAFSRKNSNECFFGWIGYFSGSAFPSKSIDFAFSSTLCPLPADSTNSPVTAIAARLLYRAIVLRQTLNINHHLKIMNSRSVIQRNKIYIFTSALCSYPTFGNYFAACFSILQNLFDF